MVYRRHLIGQKYYNFEAEDICVFINSGFLIKTEDDYVILGISRRLINLFLREKLGLESFFETESAHMSGGDL